MRCSTGALILSLKETTMQNMIFNLCWDYSEDGDRRKHNVASSNGGSREIELMCVKWEFGEKGTDLCKWRVNKNTCKISATHHNWCMH